jgi:hypothetical protein
MNRDPLPVQMLGGEPDFETVSGPLARLQREIADEYARADVECKARQVVTNYPAPVYDTTAAEGPGDQEIAAAAMADVERAVRYLDLRGLIVRPWSYLPQLVSFGGV